MKDSLTWLEDLVRESIEFSGGMEKKLYKYCQPYTNSKNEFRFLFKHTLLVDSFAASDKIITNSKYRIKNTVKNRHIYTY